jgi:triphosphatase
MPPRTRHPAPAPASGAGTAGVDARELEWQLAAPDLEGVRRWLEEHPHLDRLSIAPLPPQHLHDTYLDTEDWRLFRAGFALRLREKDGHLEATLKGLRSARDDAADRREISEPLAGDGTRALARAAGPVASRVHDVAGRTPLRTLFELRNSRRRFAVRSLDSAAALGEIALDEARFSRADGHRRTMVLTRVELEASGPDPAPLERLAHRLRTECGLHPATENKFAVGLRSAALVPPQPAEPGRTAEPVQAAIDGSTRARDFAAAALRRLAREWRALEPAARLGESPEALHALRVTGRRMDTVLRLFGAYLPAVLRKSQPRLARLLDALGSVRDADIRLEAVRKFHGTLAEADRPTLDPLLREIELERDKARSGMLRALDAKPSRQWLDALPEPLAHPPPPTTSGSARNAAALTVVSSLIVERYRKLRKCARRLTPESSLSEYHRVRVRTKRLRYALELVAPTYGKAAHDMLAALHKLQGKLGTQHDAGAVAGYLTRLADRPPAAFTPRTLFMMGRMAELHAREAARVGGRIGKPWRKVRGRRWKTLRSRMETSSDHARQHNAREDGIDRGARVNGGPA